jgi:dienelactone hydrolase
LESVVEFLKKDGATSIGGVGYCWGGKHCFLGSKDKLFVSIASILRIINEILGAHPSQSINKTDAENLDCPACILPSGDDPEFLEVQQVLKENKWAAMNIWKRFPEMYHGW